METSKYIKYSRILGFVAIMLLPVYLVVKTYAFKGEPKSEEAQYVGKQSCAECHSTEYNEWLESHHNKAMDEANEETVRGNFDNVTLEAQGHTHRFYKDNGRFLIQTDGADGTMQEFEVKYVFGYMPLQQYLVEFPGGRLQTLALTWDTERKQWYHMADKVYPDQKVDHTNWLHWTNQAQNWNSMCADCHSTNLQKGYDHETDSYHTTWSEINVSCEACHGPGSKHVEWAKLPEYARNETKDFGLVVQTSNIDNKQYVDNCVRCHSRRASLTDFHQESASIYDHVIPNLPEDPTWYIDGQILEEDYVYASFTQSRMYMKGVQCNDCHNVHSGKLLYGNQGTQYNKLCAQCHVPDIYDTPEHHFHKTDGVQGESLISESGVKMEVGSGTLCINCHMHGRNYMGVDYRRDHSFRIPRPDLSMKYGVPNACNQCHTDKSNQWSEDHITEWYGKSRRYHYAEAFSQARNGDKQAVDQLKSIAADELYPSSVRALALQHMGNYFPDLAKEQAINNLRNTDATVRLAALRAVQISSSDDINSVVPMLRDETKAIRIEAASILSSAGTVHIPQTYKDSYQSALKEYLEVLHYNADFPTGKVNLANYYFYQGDNQKAEEYYVAALKQDNELHAAKLNLAFCYNRMGQNDKSALLFEDYIKNVPQDANAKYTYGLLLSEMKQYDKSLKLLEESYQIDNTRPRVAHNIAMMYDFKGDKIKAEQYLSKEIQLMDDYNSRAELLSFYLQNQMNDKALLLAQKMKADYPDNQDLNQVIEQLE